MPRGKIGRARPDSKAIDVEIARLRELDVAALRARWHTVFGRRSPSRKTISSTVLKSGDSLRLEQEKRTIARLCQLYATLIVPALLCREVRKLIPIKAALAVRA